MILACEEASTPDVIVSTFSIFDVTIYALIDSRLRHLYLCTMLVTETSLPVESTNSRPDLQTVLTKNLRL